MRNLLLTLLAVVGLIVLCFTLFNPFGPALVYFMFVKGEHHQGRVPMIEAHQTAVTTFVQNEGFGIARLKKAGLWNIISVMWKDEEYSVYPVRLIGTTKEQGYRLFPDNVPPRKKKIRTTENRLLTESEHSAIDQLRSNSSQMIELPPEDRSKKKSLRLFAPILATKDCLKCHDCNEGDMLGAFDYHLDLKKN